MLDQRQRHWVGVAQMSYRCFVFAGYIIFRIYESRWHNLVSEYILPSFALGMLRKTGHALSYFPVDLPPAKYEVR